MAIIPCSHPQSCQSPNPENPDSDNDTSPLTPAVTHPKIEYMSALAHVIAQETQDGRRIVRFLLSAMEGQLPDFLPCHRIDAARLLVKLGFDQAQAVVDRARADQRAASRHSRAGGNPGAEAGEAQDAANDVRAQLARIVREETDDGRVAVRFLIDAMQGEFADFKPCHRLSAAKELLQRGFDYVPEPEETPDDDFDLDLDPAEREARRRQAEDQEFARHSSTYYANIRPYPCVCEDRLHDCKGNLLDDEQRVEMAQEAPGGQFVIGAAQADVMADYFARYTKYVERWNVEHPEVPIDINRIHWISPNWQHLNRLNAAQALKRIRGP